MWTPTQAGAFLDYADGHDIVLYPMFVLILQRGLRRGEAVGLNDADVDLDRHRGDLAPAQEAARSGHSGGLRVGESAHSWATGEHVILDLDSEDDDGDWEYDGEGHLASIVPVRAELAAGDTRLLYLAWLFCVQGRELDDDEVEPAVPAWSGEPGPRPITRPWLAVASLQATSGRHGV